MPLDLTWQPFSGVGAVMFFERDGAGLPLGGFDLGEAPGFNITNNAPAVEMNTTRDVSRGTAFRMTQSKAAALSIELATLTDFNWQLLTSGVWTEAAAGAPVADWVAPSGLVVGQVIKVPAQNLSAVSVVDSTGAPKTLPVGQYELDAVGGTIRLLDITTGGPYVQPFKVSYTPGAIKTLGAFKASDKEYVVHFNGTNAVDGSRAIVEAYRFRFASEGQMAFKQTEFGTYQLNGSLLLDSTKLASSSGGQYYKLVKPGA